MAIRWVLFAVLHSVLFRFVKMERSIRKAKEKSTGASERVVLVLGSWDRKGWDSKRRQHLIHERMQKDSLRSVSIFLEMLGKIRAVHNNIDKVMELYNKQWR